MSNEWIKHKGNEMPVDGDVAVRYQIKSGFKNTHRAAALDWKIKGDCRIVKYRIIGEQPKEVDKINPEHYKTGGIETIDYLKAKLSPEELKGFLKGNIIKYLSRAEQKNGAEDYKKASWYMEQLVKLTGL